MPRQRIENTLPGFALALDVGADAIELDVHVSADGTVVVHHDDVVRGRSIASTTWADLKDLVLAPGVRIPTLQEVLDLVGGRATVYIELKGRGIGDAVVAVARARGQRVALHSFDHAEIEKVAAAAPEIARGVLLDEQTPRPAEALRQAVARTSARDAWPHRRLVDDGFMRAARELDVRVIPWTVNSLAEARRLTALGVSGICTDDVRLLAGL